MMPNLDLLMNVWGWALIQFIWQGLLISVVATLLLRQTRHSKPQVRYAIALSALVLCLLVPVFNTLQTLSIPHTNAISSINAGTAAASINTLFQGSLNVAMPSSLQNEMPWIIILWLIGCILFSLRMILGLSWISQTQRNSHLNNKPELQRSLDQLKARFGIRRHICFFICDDIDSPMTAGWWKPIVLMPTALFTQLSPEYIEALIAHELAHIKRFDYLINLVQSSIEAILFFHPVVWWLSKQIRIERENIADDLAAQVLNNPQQLATALAALDQFQLTGPLLAQTAHGGNLMSRIQRLVKPTQFIFNWKISAVLAAMALACLTVMAQDTNTHSVNAVDAVKEHETYAVVIAGKKGMMYSGNSDDIKNIEVVKKSHPGTFLWFMRDRKAYIIQDPVIIEKVQLAWQDSDKLSVEMDALSAKMDVHSEAMDKISHKMDAVSSNGSPANSSMEKLSRDMQTLSTQQEATGRLMEINGNKMALAKTEAEREALDQQMQVQSEKMDVLSHKMDALSKLMDSQSADIEKAMQPLDALSKEMEIASIPMQALGQQMEALGNQMEILSHKADQRVLALINESLKNGKATPLQQ